MSDMMKKANHSIKCSVENCKYHCSAEQFCSLDCVLIGTHETDPTESECTDCKSFCLK